MADLMNTFLDPDAYTHCFNTWDSDHPADLLLPALGLRAGFAAYSNAGNTFSRFAAPLNDVRLGPRTVDGSRISLDVALHGTRLGLEFRRRAPQVVVGSWRVLASGEWGLRFWPTLWLQWGDVRWQLGEHGILRGTCDGIHVAAVMAQPPLLVTMHESIEDLRKEYETHGYWYLESRAASGRLAALRCNLEQMPTHQWAVAIAATAEHAEAAAREGLTDGPSTAEPAEIDPTDEGQSLAAIRDVVGWNTVHDPVNTRRYTALSRNWSSVKFGGFGVWLDDIFYHALLAGPFDMRLARDNLRAVFAHATPAGNLPCLVTGRDAWVDRSQPPIGSLVVWLLYRQCQDRELLEEAFAPLLANHRWWWRHRDGNDNGLLEYGSSDVGDGLYLGTALAARDESSMDNSPTHDEAAFDPVARTLDCEDVGLNSLVALDAEVLARIARVLGRQPQADELDATCVAARARIREQLWDDDRGVFANRLWTGSFVRSLAPTSFYPLLAGAASTHQAHAMRGWLRRKEHFGGPFPLPSVARDDPAFPDNVYWRGRSWPPLNFLTWHGLHRYGFREEAAVLAQRSEAMFLDEWRRARICAENYNADTGVADDQPDTDTFYGWGALMPWLGLAERRGWQPWNTSAGAETPFELLG